MKNIAIYFLMLFSFTAMAQEKKIDFFGSGRFNLNNSSLSGDLLKQDTTTARKQMTGYTLFDLGFHIRPTEETEIKAITRVTNDITGFWGGGIIFNIRELYLRGLMFKRIRYQVGDLNTKMTPYTLYNELGEINQHNPAALNTFSEIINYDKFYGTNSWRQQGATADIGFDFKKYINHIHVNGLISKNRQTDYFSTPDRLMSGLNIQASAFNQLTLSYNYTNLFDVKSSAMFSNALFNNTVNTFGLKEKFNYKNLQFVLGGEFGKSQVHFDGFSSLPNIPDGKFADGNISVQNKINAWDFELSLRSVETSFRSAGAQSRRVDFSGIATDYSYYTNRESPRPVTILGVLTDNAYYNMFISPVLKDFNPAYENMLPYGKATPNRQGTDVKLNYHHPKNTWIKVGGQASFYSEITGQGTTNLRSFNTLEAYTDFGINELIKTKNRFHLGAYYRNQKTSRDGTEGIDKVSLQSSQIKLGVEYEIIPKLDLQFATVMLQSNGNEYSAQRNSYNEIVFYKAFNAKLQETVFIGGINYQFSKYNSLKIQWQQLNWDNQLLAANQYKINRLSILYNLFF